MLIEEITIDKRNEIDCIHLKLTDDLVQFLNGTGESTVKSIPSDNALISLGIPVVDLDMDI
ncbi:MAG: hypothetical protein J1E62_03625 [Lachnospiraceae bacterium]|nr:hypothetical protein [Lachnospiraceae bacterium]